MSLKVHLHEIFDIRFFSSKASSWAPDQALNCFRIWIQIRRDIRIWRSFRILSEYAERNYYVMLRLNNRSFLVALRSNCTHTYFFWSIIPLKAVMKMIQFRTFKIIWAHFRYAEWIYMYSENTRNELNIRTKFCCSYTENTRNESVRILRIRGMHENSNISANSKQKLKIFLECLSGA